MKKLARVKITDRIYSTSQFDRFDTLMKSNPLMTYGHLKEGNCQLIGTTVRVLEQKSNGWLLCEDDQGKLLTTHYPEYCCEVTEEESFLMQQFKSYAGGVNNNKIESDFGPSMLENMLNVFKIPKHLMSNTTKSFNLSDGSDNNIESEQQPILYSRSKKKKNNLLDSQINF